MLARLLPPLASPPPWIQKMTGSFPSEGPFCGAFPSAPSAEGAAEVQTLRERQSAPGSVMPPIISIIAVPAFGNSHLGADGTFCGADGPNRVASNVPRRTVGDIGASQRRRPSMGAA